MNRTDFFKQIGAYGAGIATAIATKLSVTPKDEMKVTKSLQYRDGNGRIFNFVVVETNERDSISESNIGTFAPTEMIRDLNV